MALEPRVDGNRYTHIRKLERMKEVSGCWFVAIALLRFLTLLVVPLPFVMIDVQRLMGSDL
eukprot:7661840-Pyramimonas_sp.AAC.1